VPSFSDLERRNSTKWLYAMPEAHEEQGPEIQWDSGMGRGWAEAFPVSRGDTMEHGFGERGVRNKEVKSHVMSLVQNQESWMEKSEGVRRPIRVLVIDRSSLMLHGLRRFFPENCHINVIGMANSRAEALQAIHAEQPDLVLLEVQVGQDSGIELCRIIRDSHPQIKVLFFTTQDDKDILRSAIVAGAHGYLLKSATAESIARSIEIVAEGHAIMDQQLIDRLITWIRDGSAPGQTRRRGACSPEERHVLSLVALGKTNKEIGQELKLAPTVVASRLQKIYKRLQISRRSEAARYYIDLQQKSLD